MVNSWWGDRQKMILYMKRWRKAKERSLMPAGRGFLWHREVVRTLMAVSSLHIMRMLVEN